MRWTMPRITAGIAAVLFLSQLPSFITHVQFFLSGAVSGNLVTGNWWLVLVNIALFLVFIGFLRVRRSIDWSGRAGIGIYAAFIVSLFVEMYGVPLTIFLGAGLFGSPVTPPAYIFSFSLFGTMLGMNLWMLVGVFITVLGMVLVAGGWYQVYRADGLVTTGLYQYSRNPQYLGIICIALGWVIGWPSILTLVLFPILVAAYVHLARVERQDMVTRYGNDYNTYAEDVPLIL